MSLRLFFEGHLSWLCQNSGAGLGKVACVKPDSLYLIYAGGDDLFIAGAWDATARVALAIDEALGKYAGGNPIVHLSAGLAMGHAKYPISAGAQDADEAQQKAKDHRRPGVADALSHEKDAIHLLERTIGWEHLESAIELADKFVKAVRGTSDTAPRGFLRLALEIVNLEQKERKRQAKLDDDDRRAAERDGKPARTPRLREGQAAWGRWSALAAYHLSRARQSDKKGGRPRVDPTLVKAVDDLLVSSTGIDTLAVAAAWADLAVR
jgi:CRISPR/Cas system-associated protein Cas10 (large subunit of type III CRISPR-Cas system)